MDLTFPATFAAFVALGTFLLFACGTPSLDKSLRQVSSVAFGMLHSESRMLKSPNLEITMGNASGRSTCCKDVCIYIYIRIYLSAFISIEYKRLRPPLLEISSKQRFGFQGTVSSPNCQ